MQNYAKIVQKIIELCKNLPKITEFVKNLVIVVTPIPTNFEPTFAEAELQKVAWIPKIGIMIPSASWTILENISRAMSVAPNVKKINYWKRSFEFARWVVELSLVFRFCPRL